MAPITWTWYSPLLGGVINSPDQVIGLNQSYAFGFTITSNANVDAVCEVSAVVFGDSRRASKWTAQVLDPPVVMIPAHGSATVLVEVTTTDEGDTADPPRCELIVSAVEINPAPHVVPGQARLSIMALKEPPGPDSQSHIQLVMNAPGGSHSKLDSGIQVGQLPIDLQVFVDTPGDYNLTATLRDPTGWTIQNIYGSPFQISAGNTAGARVNLGPLTPGPGARQTDLFITVTGKPGTPSAGISATFPLPIMPWK
jgi:hypothetical protein